jgi:hypothetical protein
VVEQQPVPLQHACHALYWSAFVADTNMFLSISKIN